MDDTISRQDAINAMMALQAEDDEAYGCHIPDDDWFCADAERKEQDDS